jgi:DNA-binding CsgD family transcriptional regulator
VATVVNDAHLFSRERTIELSRLNEAERRVLRLLAEGHTAKSIAAELDMTPAAVNERLREARRKTGVGSSRELARLLKAQENRHEQIGVGLRHPVTANPPQADAEPRRLHMGVFAMIVLFVVAAAGAAALMTQQPPLSNQIDPLIGTPLVSGPEPVALHARIRSEARDNQWAAPMEAAIRVRLLKIPLIGKDGNVLRINCATDLCEIAGTIVQPVPAPKEYDPKLPQNRAVNDLQVPPLTDDLTHLGLKLEANLFTGAKDKPERLVYLLYYSRAQSK